MKSQKRIAVSVLIGMAALGFILSFGCSTSAQRTSFNTISTLETTTTAAVDGYFLLVAKGLVATNGVPAVSRDYNKFQGGLVVALDLVQNNTNALAPASLQQLSTDLIIEIGQFKGGK